MNRRNFFSMLGLSTAVFSFGSAWLLREKRAHYITKSKDELVHELMDVNNSLLLVEAFITDQVNKYMAEIKQGESYKALFLERNSQNLKALKSRALTAIFNYYKSELNTEQLIETLTFCETATGKKIAEIYALNPIITNVADDFRQIMRNLDRPAVEALA